MKLFTSMVDNNHLHQRLIVESMNDPPTMEELKAYISKLNMGKAAGKKTAYLLKAFGMMAITWMLSCIESS